MTEIYIPMNLRDGETYRDFEGAVRFSYVMGVGGPDLEIWTDLASMWDTIVTVVE